MTTVEHKRPYLIIDCRWNYEFEAGHIQDAVNIDNWEALRKYLFKDVLRIQQLLSD